MSGSIRRWLSHPSFDTIAHLRKRLHICDNFSPGIWASLNAAGQGGTSTRQSGNRQPSKYITFTHTHLWASVPFSCFPGKLRGLVLWLSPKYLVVPNSRTREAPPTVAWIWDSSHATYILQVARSLSQRPYAELLVEVTALPPQA